MIQTGDQNWFGRFTTRSGCEKGSCFRRINWHTIGPRLNALGRLGKPHSVELMTTFDEEQALEIAKYIDQQNNERKDIVTTIAKALDLIDPNAPVHILAKQGWHEGVLGIVASTHYAETGNQPLF